MAPRRSMWSGNIEFGMTSIPVKMYTAIDSERSEMHSYHTTCGRRVSMPKICVSCDRQVPSDELSSGVDYTHGRTVLFSKQELSALLPQVTHRLNITQFCPDYDVDPTLFSNAHHVMADGDGVAFASLHLAMLEEGVLAIGRITFKSKQSLVALRAVQGGFICHTLHWPETVRDADWARLASPTQVADARVIIGSLTEAFIPSEHKDVQGATVDAYIDQRKNELDLLG